MAILHLSATIALNSTLAVEPRARANFVAKAEKFTGAKEKKRLRGL
jgi:hypothetical protein